MGSFAAVLDLVAVPECLACGSPPVCAGLCADCDAALGQPLRAEPVAHTPWSAFWSGGPYAGAAGQLVRAAKFRPDEAVAARLAASLSRRFSTVAPAFDAVVAVPTTPWRHYWRGFHLPDMLAREVSRATGRPLVSVLHRRWGAAQSGRDEASRRRAAPTLLRARGVVEGELLVVDDVLTTGATLHAAAQELLAAGASRVMGLVVASAGPPVRGPVGFS